MEDGKPLFVQIAEQVASSILDGSLADGERAPSTNELASFHRINPATAAKGVNLLVERGILVKRRGLGMFVAENARELLRTQRQQQFADHFIVPLLTEARSIGLSADDVVHLIRTRAHPSPAKERAE